MEPQADSVTPQKKARWSAAERAYVIALFTLTWGVVLVAVLYTIPSVLEKEDHSTLSEIVATAALVGAYVVAALGYSTIHQATVRLGLWRCVVESVEIQGAAVLEHVSAAGEPSSPIGEGLADALGVGGM